MTTTMVNKTMTTMVDKTTKMAGKTMMTTMDMKLKVDTMKKKMTQMTDCWGCVEKCWI